MSSPSRLITKSIGGGPDDFGLSSITHFVAEKSSGEVRGSGEMVVGSGFRIYRLMRKRQGLRAMCLKHRNGGKEDRNMAE